MLEKMASSSSSRVHSFIYYELTIVSGVIWIDTEIDEKIGEEEKTESKVAKAREDGYTTRGFNFSPGQA